MLGDPLKRNDIPRWQRLLGTDEFRSVRRNRKFRSAAGKIFVSQPLLKNTAVYVSGKFGQGSKVISQKGSMFGTVCISHSGIKYSGDKTGTFY